MKKKLMKTKVRNRRKKIRIRINKEIKEREDIYQTRACMIPYLVKMKKHGPDSGIVFWMKRWERLTLDHIRRSK